MIYCIEIYKCPLFQKCVANFYIFYFPLTARYVVFHLNRFIGISLDSSSRYGATEVLHELSLFSLICRVPQFSVWPFIIFAPDFKLALGLSEFNLQCLRKISPDMWVFFFLFLSRAAGQHTKSIRFAANPGEKIVVWHFFLVAVMENQLLKIIKP